MNFFSKRWKLLLVIIVAIIIIYLVVRSMRKTDIILSGFNSSKKSINYKILLNSLTPIIDGVYTFGDKDIKIVKGNFELYIWSSAGPNPNGPEFQVVNFEILENKKSIHYKQIDVQTGKVVTVGVKKN